MVESLFWSQNMFIFVIIVIIIIIPLLTLQQHNFYPKSEFHFKQF